MVETIIRKGKSLINNMLNVLGLRRNFIVNSPVVYHANYMQVKYLNENTSVVAKPLIDELIIPPGYYEFQRQRYELTQDGLYRFMFPERINEQRIVYAGDIAALMSSLAWIVAHGESDDNLTYSALIEKAKREKLFLTCQSVCEFSFNLLSSLGIPCRLIGTRTLEQWNSYDDGHYLIEVFRKDLDKWVIYDLDTDAYFVYDYNPLSLLEFTQHLESEDYEIHSLSSDIRAESATPKQRYDFTFLNEGRLSTLKCWYKRVMQLSFIILDQENFSWSLPPKKLTRRYPKGAFPPIQYLEPNEFISRFYQ